MNVTRLFFAMFNKSFRRHHHVYVSVQLITSVLVLSLPLHLTEQQVKVSPCPYLFIELLQKSKHVWTSLDHTHTHTQKCKNPANTSAVMDVYSRVPL